MSFNFRFHKPTNNIFNKQIKINFVLPIIVISFVLSVMELIEKRKVMTKTLEEVKLRYAKDYGCETWEEYKEDLPIKDLEIYCFEVADRYAKEQNKELVEMLEFSVRALKSISSFGATTEIIDRINKTITKYK